MAELTQLKRKRNGYKGVMRKLCKKIEEKLLIIEFEFDEHSQYEKKELKNEINATNAILIEKESIIKDLDGKILDYLEDDEEFELEIEQATEYEIILKQLHERVRSQITSQERETVKRTDSLVSTYSERNIIKTNVKLPTLTLNKFNGDPTKWFTFYETFNAAVHSNDSLSNIEKFTYLKNFVERDAAHAIRGFSITSDNYEKSLNLLKERFGNTKLIIQAHVGNLVSLKPVTSDRDIKGLRILYDTAEAEARSLESLGIESERFSSFLAPIIIEKLPHQIKLYINREMQEWDIEKLLDILRKEIQAREVSVTRENDYNHHREKTYHHYPLNPSSTHTFRDKESRPSTGSTLFSGNPSCTFCKGPHFSDKCMVVTNYDSRLDILKREKRCFLCLKTSHRSKECDRKKKCFYCKESSHNSAICQKNFGKNYPQNQNVQSAYQTSCETIAMHKNSAQNQTFAPFANQNKPEDDHSLHVSGEKGKRSLLQTAEAIVSNPKTKESKSVRILLDIGSTRTYITNELRAFLNLEASRTEDITVFSFGSDQPSRKSCDLVNVMISSKGEERKEVIEVEALSVPYICAPLSTSEETELRNYNHLQNLQLADAGTGGNVKIDMLIGVEFYHSIVTGNTIFGKAGEPSAVSSKLGWLVSGPIQSRNKSSSPDSSTNVSIVHSLFVDWNSNEMNSVENQLHKFFDFDTVGIKNSEKSTVDEVIEKIALNDEGRYEAPMPFKESHPILPDNYRNAKQRLLSLHRSMKKNNPERLKKYEEIFKEQFRENVIEKVTKPGKPGETYFLPHHGIVRDDKDSTKLRIVFDASSKPNKNEPSLNDCLYKGPNLIPLLFEILLRFRIFPIALTADIEKAFLQINIPENERDYLRFLWFDNIEDENPKIVMYRFTRAVFGVTSSPFLLNGTVQKHARKYESVDQEFVEKVLESFFVDDFSGGEFQLKSANELYEKLKSRFMEGKFNLRKWRTNDSQLRKIIQEVEAADTLLPTDAESRNLKHLGVIWNEIEDIIAFDFTKIIEEASNIIPTKRSILRILAMFYDPLGLIQPIILSLKVLFQNICKEKLSWDDKLPNHLLKEWKNIQKELNAGMELRIQRCYLITEINDPFVKYEIHGFSDASFQAYGACIYIRGITVNGNVKCSLLTSKSRIAPIKQVTIPRLELLGNLILSRLYVNVSSVLGKFYNFDSCFLWTDSQITLAWIRSLNKEYKVFVENRVQEIRKLTNVENWNYCPTDSNPADLITRSWKSPCNLTNESLWWNGPSFLYLSPDQWPIAAKNVEIEEKDLEMKSVTLLTSNNSEICSIESLIDIVEFSCTQKLYRVTAWILRFTDNLKLKRSKKQSNLSAVLSPSELRAAEGRWIKVNQTYLSKEELTDKDLGVNRDENGFVRCSGRMKHAPVPLETRNPILLSRKHRLALLIVLQCHNRVNHSGEKQTLTEMRERFWISKGRSYVRSIVTKCVICRRMNTKSYDSPITPPLPVLRLNNVRAFTTVGVDNFGPLHVKDVYGNKKSFKAWGVIYTCAASRAILLDLSPDTSDSSFIRSFSRFIARRGAPDHVISDNGGNFIANDTQLYSTGRNIQWHFNLPVAPWHGGFFERLIRIVKDMLKKQLKNARLTYEELQTVFLEIERIVNNRPLTYVYPADLESCVTPNHLVFGRRLEYESTNVESQLHRDSSIDIQSYSKKIELALKQYWSRWSKEYLSELRERQKIVGGDEKRIINVGDVVIVYEDFVPRHLWRLARVEKLVEGKDGLVRGAEVKIGKTGATIKRAVTKLFPIECYEDMKKL